MILGIKPRAFLLLVVFTVVEIATLTVWVVLFKLRLQHQLAAGIVLAVGLFIEHYLSVLAGKANT
jgi:hypothetical protein